MGRILVAEDDDLLGKALMDALSTAGHSVDLVRCGSDALSLCQRGGFDLLILDWNLPNRSGLEVCKDYRKGGRAEPILFLTSRGKIAEKEAAFDCGADDYLTKPFELRELLSRVKALMRRPVGFVDTAVTLGKATYISSTGTITDGQLIVHLQPREVELLDFLIKRPNQVMRADAMLAGVWGADFDGSDVVLRACLTKLRKALSTFGLEGTIETIHGFGYAYRPDPDMP